MLKISADRIWDGRGGIYNHHVLVLRDDGIIEAIEPASEHDPETVDTYEGILIPGFINAHCHLELSHLLGACRTGTYLVDFLIDVVTQRTADPDTIHQSIQRADRAMWDEGIRAVGDISNGLDSIPIKAASSIQYVNFIETYDLMSSGMTEAQWHQALDVKSQMQTAGAGPAYIVPHAPYSMSPELMRRVAEAQYGDSIISIHSQESPSEDEWVAQGQGVFRKLYTTISVNPDAQPRGYTGALKYSLDQMSPRSKRILWVHNSYAETQDIVDTIRQYEQSVHVTCPRANLYIENRLPDYQSWIDAGACIAIGTDSLSSNWDLSIWNELACISQFNNWITDQQLIHWACYNGAYALGKEHTLGSIEIGKSPGVLLIQEQHGAIDWHIRPQVLI